MEKEIKIAARLYECRDTAKQLATIRKEDYTEMLKPYTKIIQNVMSGNKLDHLQALLKISETATYKDGGVVQLLFIAACAELMEPSV